jgi:hypothetical protein
LNTGSSTVSGLSRGANMLSLLGDVDREPGGEDCRCNGQDDEGVLLLELDPVTAFADDVRCGISGTVSENGKCSFPSARTVGDVGNDRNCRGRRLLPPF